MIFLRTRSVVSPVLPNRNAQDARHAIHNAPPIPSSIHDKAETRAKQPQPIPYRPPCPAISPRLYGKAALVLQAGKMHKAVPAYHNGAPRAAAPCISVKDAQAKDEPVFAVTPYDPAHANAAAQHSPAHVIASMRQPMAPVIAATRHRLAHAIAATQQTLTPSVADAQHITQPVIADAQDIPAATIRSPELAAPLIQNGDAPQSEAVEIQDARQIGPAIGQTAMPYEGCRHPPLITAFKTSCPLRGMRQRSLKTLTHNGLTHFKKWWYRREVDLYVRGERITGTPIFLHDNTIRVVNDAYSYFIPLHKVDYIRTTDGLRED